MSEWNWVTPVSGRWYRGTAPAPASGPVPVTTVPAASITAVTATTPQASNRRSGRTSDRAAAVPSVHLTCSATAAATTATDTTKCSDTRAGLRSVSTTIPPTTICATTPAGCTAASQIRSGRRRAPGPPGRNRQAAISTATATTVTTTVTILLPNSIQVWNMGSPRVGAATRLLRVHCGQSGQPSPDLLSRTAAPVTMMTVEEITPASAIRRMETGVGSQTAAAQRRATDPTPVAACGTGGGPEPGPSGSPCCEVGSAGTSPW